jgi:hypothetical protein
MKDQIGEKTRDETLVWGKAPEGNPRASGERRMIERWFTNIGVTRKNFLRPLRKP